MGKICSAIATGSIVNLNVVLQDREKVRIIISLLQLLHGLHIVSQLSKLQVCTCGVFGDFG